MLARPFLPLLTTVEVAVKSLNEVLGEDDPAQTLKALKNPDGNFPFIYQEASRYHKALLKERKEGLPATILVSGFLSSQLGVSSLVPRPLSVFRIARTKQTLKTWS